MGHAQCVLLFQVLGLHLNMVQLPAQKRRRVLGTLWILNRGVMCDSCGECLRAADSLRRLNLRLLVLVFEDSAEYPFAHAISVCYFWPMFVHRPRLGNQWAVSRSGSALRRVFQDADRQVLAACCPMRSIPGMCPLLPVASVWFRVGENNL